jgi:hypothetical protein
MQWSCKQDNTIITSNGVGIYKLGDKLEKEYDKNEFDITLDGTNSIKTIIVTSIRYKTTNGFGVGSELKKIESDYKNLKIEPFSMRKGDVNIGNVGESLRYKNLVFVDATNDGNVDYVMVTSN